MGVFGNLLRLAAENDLPVLHHPCVVGDCKRHVDILLDHALRLVDVLKDTGNFLDDQRSKSERRLIDQKKSRARDQRPADAEHLLLAPAQCAGGLFLALSQTRKVGVDPIDGSIEAGVDATAVCTHAQVFTHGQVLEDAAIRLARRELVWIDVTAHPTAEWIAQQITEAFPWNDAPRYLIRDRDGIYGAAVTRRLRAMGIRDKPIAPCSPWQNGVAERLIGTIRRECVDHVVAFGRAAFAPSPKILRE
jgi:hypothetical protein